jgi:hypothetical protein
MPSLISRADLKGGALASAIGAHLRDGDPFVLAFVRRVMRQLCAPLLEQLQRWLSTGELLDPHEEFFVAANLSVPSDRLCERPALPLSALLSSLFGADRSAFVLRIRVQGRTSTRCARP